MNAEGILYNSTACIDGHKRGLNVARMNVVFDQITNTMSVLMKICIYFMYLSVNNLL